MKISVNGAQVCLMPIRFTWRMLLADGKVFLEGINFGELNSDGKLHLIVGFFELLTQAIG